MKPACKAVFVTTEFFLLGSQKMFRRDKPILKSRQRLIMPAKVKITMVKRVLK